LPSGYVDNLINNLPGTPAFTVTNRPYTPGVSGNAQSSAAAAADALRTGFASGATFGSLNSAVSAATGSPFAVPNFFNAGEDIHTPRFQEWHFQVEKAIGPKMAVTMKYVGNHGIWSQINNTGLNAFCGASLSATADPTSAPCLSSPGSIAAGTPDGALPFTSFNGLPTSPADPRFLTITQINSGYNSNYNGLTASFLRRLSSFQFQLNYTWSHALDHVSNAGQAITPFNAGTNLSVTSPQNPFNVFQNMYGNADYDVRHYFSANYVYTTPKDMFQGYLGKLLGEWTISGTIFARTGLPMTIVDTGTGGSLAGFGYGGATLAGATFADQTGGSAISCGSQFAMPTNGPCTGVTNNFAATTTGFGNQRRNQVSGPNFFDTDLTLSKSIPFPHWEAGRLVFGITAYNLFNHPNFDQPDADIASSTFGTITSTVNAPTSIYGSFLGADASPRLLQTSVKLTF